MYGKFAKMIRVRDRRRRSGAVLVWCAVLLPVLAGMVGLVVDGGLMMATYREAQNAADAAALAGAYDLIRGTSNATATTDAATFVTGASYNNLPKATVVINIPPKLSANYAGQANYVEAVVTCASNTYFMQALPGFSSSQSVTAHAVAGIEPATLSAGMLALDPTASPAARVTGNGDLTVNGGALLIDSSDSNAMEAKGNHSEFSASYIGVTGNISGNGIFSPAPSTGVLPTPDPFANLPTPYTGNGVSSGTQAANNPTGNYSPGVYPNGINYTGNKAVTLAPGIYVLPGSAASTVTFGSASSVTGKGIMFYVTGNTYNATTGGPDNTDPPDPLNTSPPSGVSGTNFASLALDNSIMNFTPIDTTQYSYANSAISAFNGMLVYYRRYNAAGIDLTGNTSGYLSGTLYAKWGTLTLHGNGNLTVNNQIVIDTVNITGNGTFTFNYTGTNLAQGPRVYLVD